MQPVGNVLRRDPACGPVLHQTDAVDVGNLGTPNPLIDPVHDVAEDALGVVVELCLFVVVGPIDGVRKGDRQRVIGRSPHLIRELTRRWSGPCILGRTTQT